MSQIEILKEQIRLQLENTDNEMLLQQIMEILNEPDVSEEEWKSIERGTKDYLEGRYATAAEVSKMMEDIIEQKDK